MKLSELLSSLNHPVSFDHDREITGLSEDSRTVVPGNLFIARAGGKVDGREYIAEALQRGAVGILQESTHSKNVSALGDAPFFVVDKLSEKIGLLASRFYDHPAKHMNMIGVTGTNGKTSCTQFIAAALEMAGYPSAVIGTLGNGRVGQLQTTHFTTPDAITIQKTLADFHRQHVDTVAMEVTSHALAQHRTAGLQFQIGVLTNLTQDHTDYHGDMENYAMAKRRLFEEYGLQQAILNAEDAWGQQWLQAFSKHLEVYSYTTENVPDVKGVAYVTASELVFTPEGISAKVDTPWGTGELHSRLLGRFNLSNLLAVLTTLGIRGISLKDNLSYLSQLQSVKGRMEMLGGGDRPLVIVDYAHTPDALEQTLKTLRQHCQGDLWCVFGCGGDRDRGKRPLMGKIAQRYANQIIITDDNPRTEDPQIIIADILRGIAPSSTVVVEHNRRSAIESAVLNAQQKDMILIAGKGHESYQQIGIERIPFSDAAVVKTLLESI